MKKLVSIFVCLCLAWNANGQKYKQVGINTSSQQVSIAKNEVLEVRLPAVPSTGYVWHLKNDKYKSILQQVGNYEYISDTPDMPVGASNTQIFKFTGISSGSADMELICKRSWESDAQAIDHYILTVNCEGAYTGIPIHPTPEVTPIIQASTQRKMGPSSTNAILPETFNWAAQGMCSPVKDQGTCRG